MSKKPYKLQEWDKLFTNAPYEKHLDLLIVLGIIYRSSEGEEALRNIDLSGDSVILSRLMGHNESFAEAFDGIDVERLFYTYFSKSSSSNSPAQLSKTCIIVAPLFI